MAVSVAVLGRLGDTRGVRFVLFTSAALVAVGSLVAATAGSFEVLIAGRVVQGAGAAGMPVATFAIVAARFEGATRPIVLGVVTAVLSIVSGSGTLIGGVLADVATWRVPVALPALSLIPAVFVLPLAPAAGAPGARVDALGAALVVVLASTVVLLPDARTIDLPG